MTNASGRDLDAQASHASDRVAADHLFWFISAAYEQRSIAITTNVEFERWTQILPDAASATAILDRFLQPLPRT